MTYSISPQPSGLLTQFPIAPIQLYSIFPPLIGEAEILFKIERFVEEVRSNSCLDLDQFRTLLIEYLYAFSQVYDSDFEYCIRLKLFAWIKLEIDCILNYQPYETLQAVDPYKLLYLKSLFNIGSHLIQAEHKEMEQECIRDLNNLNTYINALLIHYARLMVVRVDLKYTQEAQPLITFEQFEQFEQHMSELRRLMGKGRQCFDNLHGFVWSMEQGDENGNYHSHILLMYDANCYQDDVYKGMEVGQLWQTITQGLGTYFNCNDPQYKQWLTKSGCCGIGIIRREDIQGQHNLITVALYLVKNKQHLRVKRSPSMKTFDHGQFRSKNRRGIANTLDQVQEGYKQMGSLNFGL